MSLETDVQELTQATTDLLVAVNVSKATLDGKVEDAGDFATASLNSANASAASAATATTQATAAGTARTGAETARDAAVVAQNNAVAVVTGGTATLTPSATKIPLSDAQGKIAKGWLTNTDLVEQTDIGTAPNEIPLNQFLGELAYLDTQNIPTLGINVANAATANVTNLMQVTEISNAVPSLNLDFAKVKQLDPRITFTRASTGTYYDGKTVAKAEENLLTFSEQFDNAAWIVANGGLGSIPTKSANYGPSPDGTTTADRLQFSLGGGTTTNDLSQVIQNATTLTSVPYTFSMYVKSTDGTSTYNMQLAGSSGSTENINVTGAWTRVVVVGTGSGATVSFQIRLRGGQTPTNANVADILVWGAQLEQRASATAYTPTTTQPVTNYIPVLLTAASGVPRFEHNPVTGESLGLEIEEQRTNLLTYSEQFDNAAWTKNKTTVVSNTAVAPDGATTANLVYPNASGTSPHEVSINRFLGSQPTAARTNTIYVKAAGWRWVYFIDPAGSFNVWFDLQNGVVGTQQGNAVGKITSAGNGWFRIEIFRDQTAGIFYHYLSFSNADNSTVCTVSGTNGVLVWGAQTETGAFPTSYIPTVASQVTRAADSAVMTGANFSSWYRQSAGTVSGAWLNNGLVPGRFPRAYSISDGTGSNLITRLADVQFSQSTMRVVVSSATQADINAGAPTNNTVYKFADAYRPNDFAACVNAGTVGTDTSGLVPIVDRLILGADGDNSSNRMNGTISRITYYPQRLSNAELVEMTA